MQKHIVKLSVQEKQRVREIISKGEHKARVIKRAQTLLASHNGLKDAAIAAHVSVTTRTVENIRKRYATVGLKRALYDAPRPGAQRKLTDKTEARLVAIACSEPPAGSEHWTLVLLRQKMIGDGVVNDISTVTLWHYLTNRGIKPWREKNVVYSHTDK